MMISLFILVSLLGLNNCQLDFYNLTFTQTNVSPTNRICLFPPNQTDLTGCNAVGYAQQLAIDAIAPIIVVGVCSLVLFFFLVASCCTPLIKVKWCKSCFRLNVFLRIAILIIPLAFFMGGFALVFAQHFTSQNFYDRTNQQIDTVNNTLSNVTNTIAKYSNDSRINSYYNFTDIQVQVNQSLQNFGTYAQPAKDALRYIWIARTTVSFFMAGFSIIVVILGVVALAFSSRIAFAIYAFLAIFLLLSSMLNIAIAEIMFLLFRDICKEVTFTNGVINLLQNTIATPINTAIAEGNEAIVNVTATGCATVSNLVTCCSAPLQCCGNLTTPLCDNVTLPSFDFKYITDVIADGGNGLVWTINQCVSSCTGTREVDGSTIISNTGFTVTAIKDIIVSFNFVLAQFGNKFSNEVYDSTCTVPYVAELFAAAGLYLFGSFLFTVFLTFLFDRWGANGGYEDDDQL